MLKETFINLNNFFLCVSDAIDLSSPSISSHQMRVAYIAWQLSRMAKLPLKKKKDIYTTALFHDIGALDPSDKLRLHLFQEENLLSHCIRGRKLFSSISFLKPLSPIVAFHHKPWKKWQEERANITDPYVLESQIILLADLIERFIQRDFFVLHQRNHIIAKIMSLSGQEVHNEIIDLFLSLAKKDYFWLNIVSPRLYNLLLKHGPIDRLEVGLKDIAQLSIFFSKIIDFKSKFTATHSTGVSSCATILSHIFGLTEIEILLMKIAGNLHDLGKLVIPNKILEKPGKLTREEFDIIKQHTYHTYMLLSSIEGFEIIAEWAAFHHEKLDGSGYPFSVTADRLNIGARIMAVADIFTALIEKRPYREGMQEKQVREILCNQVDKGLLDKKIVKLLLENYKEIYEKVREQQLQAENTFQDYM